MKNTRLAGHGLHHEGRLAYDDAGEKVWHASFPSPKDRGLHAKCWCGALSPADVTTASGARRWGAAHKDEIRAAAEVTP